MTDSKTAQILSFGCCIALIFSAYTTFLMRPQKKKSRTIRCPCDFLLQTSRVSLNCSNQRRMFFICGGFLVNSLLNLHWTQSSHFVSANHKTHCACSLSISIISSMQRRQRLSDRHWELVTLNEHYAGTPGYEKTEMEFIVATFTLLYRTSMYFVSLITKERPLPQRTFLFVCLCFLPNDGRMEWPKRVLRK